MFAYGKLINWCLQVLALTAWLGSTTPSASAQEGYRFQPPRPPPMGAPPMDLDDDFDDEDGLELGEDYPRAPFPNGAGGPPGPGGFSPGSPGTGGFNPPPPNEYRPPARGRETSAKDFRFQIVDGEYWEKGKKRTRGAKTHVSSAGSNNKR